MEEESDQQLLQRIKELEDEVKHYKNQSIKISNQWESDAWKNLEKNDKSQERINALNKLVESATKISNIEQKRKVGNIANQK